MRISSLDDWLSPTPVYTHSGKGYVLVGSSNGMLRLFDGLTGAVVCLGGGEVARRGMDGYRRARRNGSQSGDSSSLTNPARRW